MNALTTQLADALRGLLSQSAVVGADESEIDLFTVYEAEQALAAYDAQQNLIDAGGTAPAMEDVPRRGRTEECPPIVVDPEGDEANDMVMGGDATAWIRIGDRLIVHLSTHGSELEVEVLPKADVTGVPYNRFKIDQ